MAQEYLVRASENRVKIHANLKTWFVEVCLVRDDVEVARFECEPNTAYAIAKAMLAAVRIFKKEKAGPF